TSWKSSSPCRVISRNSSASRYGASEARHHSPSGTSSRWPSGSSRDQWLSSRWYGPATTDVMYVDSGGVGAKDQVREPSPPCVTDSAAELDSTCHWAGAVTTKVKGALRSGCSAFANTRRASAGSYCV